MVQSTSCIRHHGSAAIESKSVLDSHSNKNKIYHHGSVMLYSYPTIGHSAR